jgi:hypothetical protein
MDGTSPALDQGPDHRLTGDVERVVRCAACRLVLTTAAMAMSDEGGHEQTFVNPDGEAFTIRLFREAPGVETQGVPQGRTSWFPGTAWVFGLCGACRRQVGWRYSGRADFFGLIADRIVDD